jgi:hypothetical protein
MSEAFHPQKRLPEPSDDQTTHTGWLEGEREQLRELLRQVTLDYGFNCTDPETCECSMGRAIRLVKG